MELEAPSPESLEATTRALSQDPFFEEISKDLTSRGEADFKAFWHAYHDPFVASEFRKSSLAHYLEICEEERCLALGAKSYPGSLRNLEGYLPSPLEAEFREAVRASILKDASGSPFASLLPYLQDQKEFSKRALHIIKEMFGESETDLNSEIQKDAQDLSENESGHMDESESSSSQESTESLPQDQAAQESVTPAESEGEPGKSPSHAAPHKVSPYYARHYHVFTKAFDKVSHIQDIASTDEQLKLWQTFSEALHDQDPSHKAFHDATLKLRHLLEIRSEIIRHFDQEEGILNSQRLTRILTSPTRPQIYYEEEVKAHLDTAITLLIDNSGSMRGRPILLAALAAYRLGMLLDKCMIPFEVLGFTTQEWKGGHSRQKWVEEGKTDHPGRLNDLLHVIYKPSRLAWRKTHRNLALMMKESLLKENIDGEALIWAYERLLTRPENRKVLIVISDGAPVDDSTLSTNGMDFLDTHLKSVTKTIEAHNKVELFAIGIGHEVDKFYSKSTVINSAEELGDTLFKKVIDLLT